MSLGQYRSAGITLTDAQVAKPQMDASGNIKVTSGGTGSSADQVQGNVAGAATDSGNPVKVGAIYNATPPTYTNGQRSDLQTDTRGSLRVGIWAGASQVVVATPSDGASAQLGLTTFTQNAIYNGASWDRLKKPASVNRLLSAAASTNATSAKATAGDLFRITGYSARGSACYLKLYNKASAPTVGTDTPVATFYIPQTAAFDFALNTPLYFSAGIAYAITTAAADADTGALTAADIVCLNLLYT